MALGAPQVDFTTLGMFIIDEIHSGPPNARTVVRDAIGGAGTYSIIGARLFSPPPYSHRIGWIVDAGRDFPPAIRAQLKALDTNLLLRESHDRLTTRGWNSYGSGSGGADDHREFRYLTPKKRLEADDLIVARLVVAKTIHFICSPVRAQMVAYELCGILDDCRPGAGAATRFIWEPVPDLCTPEHRLDMYKTLKLVHVVSPNHAELAGFYGIEDPADNSSRATIEALTAKLVAAGIGPQHTGAAIVRCGKMGCLVASRGRALVWLPAYYSPTPTTTPTPRGEGGGVGVGGAGAGDDNHEKVVDPTGGGNTFIGGVAIGLVRYPGNFVMAAAMGAVAASFAIEQIGIPVLEKADAGAGRRAERWNGVEVGRRFEEYRARVEAMGVVLETWEGMGAPV
ncbi:Ribokinase-like protein [Morchella snyderi]|nr:Ribokinase-like protein [Morchella snyderi]